MIASITLALLLAGTDQAALHAAAASTCAAFPLRTTGTIHYFCDCQAGAEPGCAGHEGSDSSAGTSPDSPKRTLSALVTTFNGMQAGDTIALCRGGAFATSSALDLYNTRCAAAADARVAANTTTCDIRDYTASWGGVARPVVRETGPGVNLFELWFATIAGVRILNLDLDGSGTGPGGTPVAGRAIALGNNGGGTQDDLLVCNNLIHGWQYALHVDEVPVQRLDVWGNRITGNSDECFLGSTRDGRIDANVFDDCGSGGLHTLYLGANHVACSGMQVVNNQLLRTRGGPVPPCGGAVLVVHGKLDGLTIENNVIDGGSGAGPSCFLVQITGDPGYSSPRHFDGLTIRRNLLDHGGTSLVGVSECPDAVVENNVLVARQANTWAISSPAEAATGADHVATRVTIRNNTVHALAAGVQGIQVATEGTGHVIANNAVVASGGTCFSTPLAAGAYAFVGNDACSGGTWGTTYDGTIHLAADPLFVSSPGDLSLQPTSPLRAAGNPAYAPAVDFLGNARPATPSIGAYDVGSSNSGGSSSSGGGGSSSSSSSSSSGGPTGGGGGSRAGCGTSGELPGALAGLMLLALLGAGRHARFRP